MSNDGANLGVTANRALETILGGKESPTYPEIQRRDDVLNRVLSAVPNDYSGATDCIARAVLRLFEERPETRTWPTEPTYTWPDTKPDSPYDMKPTVTGPDLYAALKESATPEELDLFDGMTGFMWGFAVNTARFILKIPSGPNPAIVTVGGDDA